MSFELNIHDKDGIQEKIFLTWDNIADLRFYEHLEKNIGKTLTPQPPPTPPPPKRKINQTNI